MFLNFYNLGWLKEIKTFTPEQTIKEINSVSQWISAKEQKKRCWFFLESFERKFQRNHKFPIKILNIPDIQPPAIARETFEASFSSSEIQKT